MRKYISLFFSVSLLLFACHRSPQGIIKPDVMANVLTEVHLADGEMLDIPQIPDSMYKYGMGKYLQIFKKYQVDSAEFRKSYIYYTKHPGQMSDIYDAVLKKLTAKGDSITALIAKNNTTQMKKNKPGNLVGGKMVPGATTPIQPARPPLPSKPGVPGNTLPTRDQILLKMRLHRDSMMRRNLPKTHAIPR
jgi:hypothetical protein